MTGGMKELQILFLINIIFHFVNLNTHLFSNRKTVFCLIYEIIQIDYIFLKNNYLFNHYTACIYTIN